MAQKNKLQFIILGLLNQQPLTGYDLTKAFDSEIGEFWQAQHSQIYPQLKRLESQGYITHEITISGEKLEKKLYHITPTGQALVRDWITTGTPELTASKDEFILKLYFVQTNQDPRLPEMLTEQLQLHTEKLAHLKMRLKTVFPTVTAQKVHYGHYLILQHALGREQYYVEWLQQTLAALPTV
ncbi:PadR family transcriptional regulator [Lactiplantibacillus fabifermentans]|uniref:Regulator of phenolic acid metabolism padr (Transcriptional repressor padr) n=2 Tax=Lactiplantibacillus fabifermentans TaxID=483011 RepID=A0A0R2NSF8_9LACO|nr:PadR family transcriptional regulator [Lactiplantibacillus fabifermentans]ETY72886.1 PadR family transcriptional regulator [Lactiplantibacillus fabifermentans T30PCM01]KRO26957.1 regulator of phenolic acid metabolism padr (transcriptional repressor padr) [Lactiplantibacillus fabifermentans DSM 21115]